MLLCALIALCDLGGNTILNFSDSLFIQKTPLSLEYRY